MDYQLLILGLGLFIGGFFGLIVNSRKGWNGFKNQDATMAQRRTDLLGGIVFTLASLVAIGCGAVVTFFAMQPPYKSERMATMEAPAETRKGSQP
jgi:hypothetical protein